MLRGYTVEELVIALEEAVMKNEFKEAYAISEELELIGGNTKEVLKNAFNKKDMELENHKEKLIEFKPNRRPTLEELREQRRKSRMPYKLKKASCDLLFKTMNNINEFNLDEFILRRPWLLKTINYFFERYEVEVEVEELKVIEDEEVEVIQKGKVYHINFKNGGEDR